jgi:hypothetical protein
MASRISHRRWLLRDIRPTYVLLVSVTLIVATFSFFIDRPTDRHERVMQPKADNVEAHYVGSIIVPTGGGLCWTYILDNRTEGLRDGGYSKCDDATRQYDEKNPSQSMDTLRLHDIGNAFRNKGS